jgi:acyl-CoA synthetase (AMP-forming)/AMP-acid ligase II
VLIALLDTIDWPTVFLGTLHAGRVAVPVNTLLTEDDYRFILADCRPRVLVVSEALYPKFAKLVESIPIASLQVIVAGSNTFGHLSLEGQIEGVSIRGVYRPPPTTRDDIAFWLYTSCSTGQPKAAARARRFAADQRPLCGADLGPYRERCLLFRGKTVLRLWPRQR